MMFKSTFLRIVSGAKTGIQVFLIVGLLTSIFYTPGRAEIGTQRDIVGPLGSVNFGNSVTVLPNGNIVIVDTQYIYGPVGQVGAVYLYDGDTLEVISMLKGSHPGDLIGSGINLFGRPDDSGIGVLPSGDFLVLSPFWNDARGALTFCSSETGCNGEVSGSNSLIGSHPDDMIGVGWICFRWCYTGVNIRWLPNGNYVVGSPRWARDTLSNAGAVTLCNGTSGCVGEISPFNSLVGRSAGDYVGFYPVSVTPKGDFFVSSLYWDNEGAENAGALTFCSGIYGCLGEVDAEYSLVGTHKDDGVGQYGSIVLLSNDAYLVLSRYWDNGVITDTGAVTWCDGLTLCAGEVSAENSLVGSSTGDQVGMYLTFPEGNYLIYSPYWDHGVITDTGAMTWCNGTVGCMGELTPENSVLGTNTWDINLNGWFHGNGHFGNFNPYWDSETVPDAGAVTWCDNLSGCIAGDISEANSLVGTQAGDQVGMGLALLSNGNYVVSSPMWSNGTITNTGAVTWCENAGCTGVITSTNSLHGSHPYDNLGTFHTFENGNYLVSSPNWDQGVITDTGIVTLCDGMTGCFGEAEVANSLVGSQPGDQVGVNIYTHPIEYEEAAHLIQEQETFTNTQTTELCVLSSGCADIAPIAPSVFEIPTVAEVKETEEMGGAIGLDPSVLGIIPDAKNLDNCVDLFHCYEYSLRVHTGAGRESEEANVNLSNDGAFVVSSPYWDNGSTSDVGAVTLCEEMGCTGVVTVTNSLVGSLPSNLVGVSGVYVFESGYYVVLSSNWESGVITDTGAMTWCSMTTGCTGEVNVENSLVGSQTGDMAYSDLRMFESGEFIVRSPLWDNGANQDAGAVTWCKEIGCTGVISETNSLVGSLPDNLVGMEWVREYENGYFMVYSPYWESGVITDTGAITFCSIASGCSGVISSKNSFVGKQSYDLDGYYGVTMLQNGYFLIVNPYWDSGVMTDTGAVTLCAPEDCFGEISAENSLVGTHPGDSVGEVVELANHNLVIVSSGWDGEFAEDVGAMTWCSATACKGKISELNSLVGVHPGDVNSIYSVHPLANGNFVVANRWWDNGDTLDVGAVTWCSGLIGCRGYISEENSLVGSHYGDAVGLYIMDLDNDTYMVVSRYWDNGTIGDAGAITWCSASWRCTGPITPSNSVMGQHSGSENKYIGISYQYGRYMVLRPMDHAITFITWVNRVYLPAIAK